jgi:ribosome-associated protein
MTAKRAKTSRPPSPARSKAAATAGLPKRPPVKKKAAARGPVAARAKVAKGQATKAPPPSRAAKPAKASKPAKPSLRDTVLAALADMKAVNVKALDVRGLTDITDTMVVASGTSDRHVKSIADRVLQRCKEAGYRPYGIEGERDGEWVLLDLQDVVLHVMLPRVREFYALEKLWEGGGATA